MKIKTVQLLHTMNCFNSLSSDLRHILQLQFNCYSYTSIIVKSSIIKLRSNLLNVLYSNLKREFK